MNTYLRWTFGATIAAAMALGFAGNPGVEAQGIGATVSIRDDYFNPNNLVVPVGASVRWVQQGANRHTTTSDTGLWSSGTMLTGQVFSYTFNTPGTYEYYCVFHRTMGMVGRVTVSNGTSPPGGGANLALNKPVRASSSMPANPPQLAVDGNLATFWASAAAGGGPYAAPMAPDGAAAPDPPAMPDAAADVSPAPDGARTDAEGMQPEAVPESSAASLSANQQWIMVDLLGSMSVQQLRMRWTSNYARSYYVYAHMPTRCGGWCALGVTNSGDGDDTLSLSRAVSARYFLLQLVYPAMPNGPYELREWEVLASSGGGGTPQPAQDVAAGRPAQASSQMVGYEAMRATDRQLSTEWRSVGLPAWIYVDFGSAYTVDRAVLRWAPTMYATNFQLYAWNGYGWQLVRSITGGDGGDDNVTFGPIRTRYLLLNALRGYGPNVGLSEFEVWTATGSSSPYAVEDGSFGSVLEQAPDTDSTRAAPPGYLPDLRGTSKNQ